MDYFTHLFDELSTRAKNILGQNEIDTLYKFHQYVKTNKDFKKLRNLGNKTNNELLKFKEKIFELYSTSQFDQILNEYTQDIGEIQKDSTIINVNDEDENIISHNQLVHALKYFNITEITSELTADSKIEDIYDIYLNNLELFVISEYTNNGKILIDIIPNEIYTDEEKKIIGANRFKLYSKISRSLKHISLDIEYILNIINNNPERLAYLSQLVNALGFFLVYTDQYIYFKKINAKQINNLISQIKTKKLTSASIEPNLLLSEIYLIDLLSYFNFSVKNDRIVRNDEKKSIDLVYDYLLLKGQSQKLNDIVDHFQFNEEISNYLFNKIRRDNRFQKIGKTGLVALKEWNEGELSSLLTGTARQITQNIFGYYKINKISFRTIKYLLKSVGWITDNKTYYANIQQTSKNEFKISNQIIYSSYKFASHFDHIFNRSFEIIRTFQSGDFHNISQNAQFLLIIEQDNFEDSELAKVYKIKSELRQIGNTFNNNISVLARNTLEKELFEYVFQTKLETEASNLVNKGNKENALYLVKSILENKYIDYSEHQLILNFLEEHPEEQENIINLIRSSIQSKLVDYSKQIEVVLNSNNINLNSESIRNELQYLFFNTVDDSSMEYFIQAFEKIMLSPVKLITHNLNYLNFSFEIRIDPSNFSGLLIDFNHENSKGLINVKSQNTDEISRLICLGTISLLLNRNVINPIEIHSHYDKIQKIVRRMSFNL